MRSVVPVLKAKAHQISLLANEMVEAARLEDKPPQLKRKRIDLRELVRRTMVMAGATASSKHRLHFDDAGGGELLVLGDLMRLEIVVNNPVDNAIKDSPPGGDVVIPLSTQDQHPLVALGDQGIGIA